MARRLKSVEKATAAAVLTEHENELARKAYVMRSMGHSWFSIAEELQISEHRASELKRTAFAEAAKLVSDGARSELLAMEVGRLDDLQLMLWPSAQAGDVRAISEIRQIITSRARLLGLEETNTAANMLASTVVVGGSTEEYIAALRAVAEPRTIEGNILEA